MGFPHGHPKTTSLVASLRRTEIVAPLVIDGPINGEWFEAYVAPVLVPTLKPDDAVILGNICSHKQAWAHEKIEAAGAHAVPPALQPRLQSHREGILEAESAPAQSGRTHCERPVGQDRETNRPSRASRGPQLLHFLLLRPNMKGKALKLLHGCPHHLITNIDVALRGSEVPVACQSHYDFGSYTGMSEPGNEPASATMRRRSVDASLPVDLSH